MKNPADKRPFQFGIPAVFVVMTVVAYLAAAWAANVVAIVLCVAAFVLLVFSALYRLARPRPLVVRGVSSGIRNEDNQKQVAMRSSSAIALSAGALLLFIWNAAVFIDPPRLAGVDTLVGFRACWAILGVLALAACKVCGREGCLFLVIAVSLAAFFANAVCCYCVNG
ncbi:MAG TPA: hypothetical protein VJ783_30255 [Pirellulales bacterium]|nr:hypothetical protein [Pirellulales bacterium]